MNHRVRGNEVEPGAARLEADQKYICVSAFELIAESLTIFGGPGQAEGLDSPLGHSFLEEAEHSSELREDEDPPPFSELRCEEIEEELVLGGTFDLSG